MPETRIAARDGSGAFSAYIAKPKSTPSGGPAGAVVMIQEIFGINGAMRALSDWVAEMGFVAVAPDLFWRQQPGVDLDPELPEHTRRRASDGRSIWIEPTASHATSEAVLAQEQQILDWAADATAYDPQPSATVERGGLDVVQHGAASAVAGYDPLTVIVGPAGAGKTTMLRAAVTALHAPARFGSLMLMRRPCASSVCEKSPCISRSVGIVQFRASAGRLTSGASIE